MTKITIPAQVVNGHLQHEKRLDELEGRHVLVTITVVPAYANESEEMLPNPEFVWNESRRRLKAEGGEGSADSDPH